MIALVFWDSWPDVCNHDFPGRYAGIDKDTWPILARILAEKLALEKEISDPLILEHFRFEPGPSLLDRFKSYFRK